MSNLIPSQTGLTLRRTDTLINLTNKLLAKTGVKGIGEMSYGSGGLGLMMSGGCCF
ncbi:hypothetical protein LP090_09400 [Moraxella bovis]|uniref:hypothetical protein n=1 Tax=Moraxella bovis TaxID=476 RepID=UPI002226DFAD|nr:hypothetical protein [Moraxella bovis]UYZ69176.1 hypothetical protein LP122_03580 [Moraxella bovis]UYZ71549.1 hypothetical protein LP089_03635 [Moraxella bovis]UYZ72537.1 hypothetical protein LP105_09025 [Moraxella bovis]UZA14844.1 hypothetical protein LP102_03575 [Moraxella bovis]UZA26794.1 hypothetical protein LP119_09265 [Moraxella bovis]